MASKKSKSKRRTGRLPLNEQQRSPAAARDKGIISADRRLWKKFVARHSGHPAIEGDTIFALPEKLIDALCKTPDRFLSLDEEAFERDLARTSGGGFCMGRPILHPALPKRNNHESSQTSAPTSTAFAAAQKSIEEMLREDKKVRGLKTSELDANERSAASLQTAIDERRCGFTGWLVTDPVYREACRDYREKWGAKIDKVGQFPSLPPSVFGESHLALSKRHRKFYDETMEFFRNWGLESLATWELPVPMSPQLLSPNFLDSLSLIGAGIHLFVPWYLMRDKKMRLQEVAAILAREQCPCVLHEWLEQTDRWGHKRFKVMLLLYLHLDLGLDRRYPDKVRRRLSILDRAFGEILDTDEESIRKDRLEMRRRIRRDGPA
jgi:hypothetical protein